MRITRRGLLSLAVAPVLPLAGRDRWNPILSENLPDLKPATLRWLAQIGCEQVVFQGTDAVDADGKGYWSVADVRRARQACEAAGLKLYSMMLPNRFYEAAKLGKPGRERDIENCIRTVKAVGEAGVPMMEWRFKADFLWDSRVGYSTTEGRGGVRYKTFNYDTVRGEPPIPEIGSFSEQEMRARFLYFGRPFVEAASKAGVKLSIHPNDPPVPSMRGAARIFHHTDGFRRMIREIPDPANGITFCQGTITEMGVNVLDEIRYFGGQGRIHLVHFRAVRGKVPRYTEVFIDEGDVDMLQAMKAFRDVGYPGPFVSDHTPRLDGDTPFGQMGRSYSHGYMRALIHAVNSME